ncbi:MAG: Holliday junction branch migration protein RuvA [Patescibacteria group bacterium]|nr:Holliday junction branch migration protein RuvA [Patescibacteria group bacterium]
MIATLRGKVLEVHAFFLVLEVNGIGYQIKSSSPILSKTQAGEDRLFYIHDHVREDVRDLYGFGSWSEQEFFEKLLGISGVGPKVALTLMSVGPLEQVKSAVMRGDLSLLTSVPGVGKKTAQKIILELKGLLVEDESTLPGDSEVADALVSLGYTLQQAREALKSVPSEILSIPERIKIALKYLGK